MLVSWCHVVMHFWALGYRGVSPAQQQPLPSWLMVGRPLFTQRDLWFRYSCVARFTVHTWALEAINKVRWSRPDQLQTILTHPRHTVLSLSGAVVSPHPHSAFPLPQLVGYSSYHTSPLIHNLYTPDNLSLIGGWLFTLYWSIRR